MPAAYLKGPSDVLPSVQIPYWCAGKQRFDSAVLANEVAERRKDVNRDIYFCRSCGSFHVGSQRAPLASKAAVANLIRSHR